MQVWSKSTNWFRRQNTDKAHFYNLHSVVTLEIRSHSPKSNQIFQPSQRYNIWSLARIRHFGARDRVQTTLNFGSTFENFNVPLWPWKWGQGHQNLITSFPLPIVCLCKFGQNPPTSSEDRVQTRSYVDANGICTKSNQSPSVGGGWSPLVWGHNDQTYPSLVNRIFGASLSFHVVSMT